MSCNCAVIQILTSEALGPPQFQEKRSRREKAILGALGAFRGILGAALGVQNIILGMRNPILGMASHDLCNAKTRILGWRCAYVMKIIHGCPWSHTSDFTERSPRRWQWDFPIPLEGKQNPTSASYACSTAYFWRLLQLALRGRNCVLNQGIKE